jgi:hypothetical protein
MKETASLRIAFQRFITRTKRKMRSIRSMRSIDESG